MLHPFHIFIGIIVVVSFIILVSKVKLFVKLIILFLWIYCTLYRQILCPYYYGYDLGYAIFKGSFGFKAAYWIGYYGNDFDLTRNYLLSYRNSTSPVPLPGITVHQITVLGGLKARVYVPHYVNEEGEGEEYILPSVLYFHGGAWTLNDLDVYDKFCRTLANESRTVVYALDYRKAPEHTHPSQSIDSLEFLKWVKINAPNYYSDPDNVVISGDSAGAGIALAATLYLRDKTLNPKLFALEYYDDPDLFEEAYPTITGMMLIYGAYFYAPNDLKRYPECYQDEKISVYGHVIDLKLLDRSWRVYAGKKYEETLQEDRYVSPLSSRNPDADYDVLPPVLLLQTSIGILYCEGLELRDVLLKAGTDVELYDVPSYHGYCQGNFGIIKDWVLEWLEKIK